MKDPSSSSEVWENRAPSVSVLNQAKLMGGVPLATEQARVTSCPSETSPAPGSTLNTGCATLTYVVAAAAAPVSSTPSLKMEKRRLSLLILSGT
ncbi:hypothetical protein EYF80_006357 [Liparis tanakae]|uniref:Uncharacterized protein n=1 Tax=Liparis tanakae TaxID=230148 RepID=A0A4Z2IZQ7_9TELE|nr:hypothetical protein EYF80_006357 [Liparis tanakae]